MPGTVQADASTAERGTGRCTPHAGSPMRCWLLTIGIGLVGSGTLVGCSGFARQWQREDIISARQIALRGMDAVQAEDWDRAEQLFAQAVQACPVDHSVRSQYAEALWRRQAAPAAIEQMREAVRLSGGDSQLVIRLGEMYLAVDQLDRAGELADQAINARHENPRAYRLRGDVDRRRGDWAAALAAYHRALNIQPHFPEVEMAVAQTYRHQRRPQRALSTLQALAAKYPSGQQPLDLQYWQANVLIDLQRYRQAAAMLASLVPNRRQFPDVLYLLAESRLYSGDLAAAQMTLDQAVAEFPNHPAARRLQAAMAQSLAAADRPNGGVRR